MRLIIEANIDSTRTDPVGTLVVEVRMNPIAGDSLNLGDSGNMVDADGNTKGTWEVTA